MTALVEQALQLYRQGAQAVPLPYLAGVGALGATALAGWRAATRSRRRRLTFDRLVIPVVSLVVVVGGAGALYTSLAKVTNLAGTWLPGLLIDGFLGVFTVISVAKARRGKRVVWIDRLQWVLILVTVVANAWGEANPALMLLHGCQPILWKGAVAGLKALLLDDADVQLEDRIPAMRWVLAPGSTFQLWRWITLGRIPSYKAAVDLENDALLAVIAEDEDRSPIDLELYAVLAGERLAGEPVSAATHQQALVGAEDALRRQHSADMRVLQDQHAEVVAALQGQVATLQATIEDSEHRLQEAVLRADEADRARQQMVDQVEELQGRLGRQAVELRAAASRAESFDDERAAFRDERSRWQIELVELRTQLAAARSGPGGTTARRTTTRHPKALAEVEVDPEVVAVVRRACDELDLGPRDASRDDLLRHLRKNGPAPHATKVGAALKHLRENP